MDCTKKWYLSKLFWIGIIQIALAIFEALQGQIDAGITLTILGVLTIIFRVLAKSALVIGNTVVSTGEKLTGTESNCKVTRINATRK